MVSKDKMGCKKQKMIYLSADEKENLKYYKQTQPNSFMGIKEFLKPEWKKFVLSIILIMSYLVLLSNFYSYGAAIDTFIQEQESFSQELKSAQEQNNTLLIEQLNKRGLELRKSINPAMLNLEKIEFIYVFIEKIDPFLNVPCELVRKSSCEHYGNKKTYDSSVALMSITSDFNIFEKPDIIEYRKASVFTALFNVVILFIEGYLLSSIILFIFRILKKTKKQELNNENIQEQIPV